MSATKWIVLLLMLLAAALFVPFIPQTRASGHIVGIQYQQTAIVSPTYYVFHCGSYVDMKVSTQLGSHMTGSTSLPQATRSPAITTASSNGR